MATIGLSLAVLHGAVSVACSASAEVLNYIAFTERDLFNGTIGDEAVCQKPAFSVWVTIDGIGDCIRYYASGIEAGPNAKAMVFLHGDRIAGTRARNDMRSLGNYKRTSPDDLQRQVDRWSEAAGIPFIFLARPGTYGSSGDHAQRRRPREIALVAAAFDAIAAKHSIERFGIAGQSGGGLLTATLLAGRQDIDCAALSSAASSIRTRMLALNMRVDATGYFDSVDASVNLPEYDVSLGWLIMRPFFLPRQAPYFHLREPSRSSWG